MSQPFDNRDWDIRKLAEKDAEIERLKQTASDLQRECQKRGSKIADLERLLARAADALESGHEGRTGLPYEEKPGCQLCDLIAELRKAAR